MSQARCMCCGGGRITLPTNAFASGSSLHLRYKNPDDGLFAQPISLYWRGAACLDCGHVMLFLEPKSLQKARHYGSLQPWN